MTPTDKSMMVEALMDMAFALEIAARDYHCAPDKYLQQELIDARAALRAAIEQYGKEQYARGVNDAWPAGRGSGEPVAMLHDDGYWTHPPGRDPLDRFSGKVRMEVYAAPQPRETLTEEQIMDLLSELFVNPRWPSTAIDCARAIERAHNIRSAK